jgi:tRNA A37 methylthiotransferase MiaB
MVCNFHVLSNLLLICICKLHWNSTGPGARFADLIDEVSLIDPEMRVRFTSPHPKDFPDEVLRLVKERSNLCSALHLPVQSGSTSVLSRMRRGYRYVNYF